MIDPLDKQTIDLIDTLDQKIQVIGYMRVSTSNQNTDRQLDSVKLDKVFLDKISGDKMHRPQLDALIEYARSGDIVIVHSFDRLARSLVDLIAIIEKLNSKGVTVRSLKENLTFSSSSKNPLDKFLLHILGAVAEFQKALINDNAIEGVIKAKERGAYKGRKKKLTDEQVERLREFAALKKSSAEQWKCLSWNDLAKEFDVTKQTIFNYLKRL